MKIYKREQEDLNKIRNALKPWGISIKSENGMLVVSKTCNTNRNALQWKVLNLYFPKIAQAYQTSMKWGDFDESVFFRRIKSCKRPKDVIVFENRQE